MGVPAAGTAAAAPTPNALLSITAAALLSCRARLPAPNAISRLAAECDLEVNRWQQLTTTDFLTCAFAGTGPVQVRPRTSCSTSDPYCSSLRAPMPGIAISAASSVGSSSAIAIRVLSVKTT